MDPSNNDGMPHRNGAPGGMGEEGVSPPTRNDSDFEFQLHTDSCSGPDDDGPMSDIRRAVDSQLVKDEK
eukprot:12400984-Karenia_brevis.AAC.1